MTNHIQNKSTFSKMPANKIISISKYIWLFFGLFLSIALLLTILLIFVLIPSAINALDIRHIPERLLVELIGSMPVLLIYLSALIQVVYGVFSFLHVLQLCLTKKALKRKPAVIIFRVLTVLFGIASIVCTVLLFTGDLCIYDYLRTVVLFFGGSIALNIAVE